MKRVDRMDNPISHTSAITAGVSFLLLFTIIGLVAGIGLRRVSVVGWGCAAAAMAVFVSSLITYFKPFGWWAFVAIGAAALVLLLLCIWSFALALSFDGPRRTRGIAEATLFFLTWLGWIGTKYRQLRRARSRSPAGAVPDSHNLDTRTET